MEDLQKVLQGAENEQWQVLHALAEAPEQVARLKVAVLFLLDVLCQVETEEARRETMGVLRRVFVVCATHCYDSRAFREDPTGCGEQSGLLKADFQQGNVVLSALLATLTALTSRPNVDGKIVEGVVALVRELCVQSMNATDVVMLFDFLRLGQPPARQWVLQMQKSLMEMDTVPRAIFTMRGPNAGLIVPSEQPLFTKKGYSYSVGVFLDSSARIVSLYSFRGQNGQGVSAALEENLLVVRSYAGQGTVLQLEVPFAECRARMEKTWVHLCIVHAKKMVFKDKLMVYVDGKTEFSGNLGYPDPLSMTGGQNSIGAAPLADGLQGKLWSPTLFGVALTEAEAQKLHWRTHWKSDLSSAAAENAGLTDKSKFIFCYDARSCNLERRICYDVSGNDCHGALGPGTRAYVTQNFVQALDSVGGCACFLLLLLDQIPEMADFHPKHEFRMEEISDLLAFVGAGLRHSIVCRSHFTRLQGLKVVEFVLQSISPSYLSVHLLDGVVSMLEAMTDLLERDEEAVEEYIHRLLFFNTSWFLSPFETQVKLLGEVLPKYLEILQKMSLRDPSRSSDSGPTVSSSGKLTVSSSTSNTRGVNSMEAKHEVDVSFFCRLTAQVYTFRAPADKDSFTTGQLHARQLEQLRELILRNLIDRLLFPPVPDAAIGQWRQLVAHIFRQCDGDSKTLAFDGDCDGVDVEAILHYLTQMMTTDYPRRVAAGVPTRQQQLATNIFKLSKGTVRALWRPMLSTIDSVRLAALRLFELYTSDKVLLHRSDMLMLYSSFQAHMLTADVADLLLDIVIGRKRSSPGATKDVATPNFTDVRAASMARMTFIPVVLLGLIHNAEFDVQVKVLSEIKVQLVSPTMGDSLKEAIRSWPPWLSRLRSLTLGAAAANIKAVPDASRDVNLVDAQALNEACAVLSGEYSPAFAKLEAIQVLSDARDISGCDFALSLLQSSNQSAVIVNSIIAMVVHHFPNRCCELVGNLANQTIVDMVVYCIIRVKNGWLHFLEFYFGHFRRPSDLCSLMAMICEQAILQAGQRQSHAQAEVIWENLCQVAAVVSQCQFVAAEMVAKLKIDDAILSPGQQRIVTRKAFELWLVVLPHLSRINWDGLTAHLVQNADYGSEVTHEETEIFCNLVATRTRSSFLALQTTIQHLTFAQASNATDAELTQSFHYVLDLLKLIGPLPSASPSHYSLASSSASSPSSLTGSPPPSAVSPPASGSMLPDMALSLPVTGIAESSDFLYPVPSPSPPFERELIHMYTLDACFTLLDSALVEGKDTDVVSLLIKIMVSLANTALHLRNPSASPELTKTLQIMSSTDLAFFSELSQLRELSMLWQLHREVYQWCCDREALQSHVDALNADFSRRWLYLVEHHVLEFNPYLIQRHASSQAQALGEELHACEELWKEITEETETAAAIHASEVEMADESRLIELKQITENFASSVHKLLARSSNEVPQDSLFGEDAIPVLPREGSKDISDERGTSATDGVIYKIDSRENGFRMRLRLKKVTENYRVRNLSCEYPGSSLTDTDSKESGRRLSRRFRGSIEGGLADLEHSWRSDAGSDYSDFLADAQMRAAIIRSLSNAEEYESAYDGLSDEDDLDDDEMRYYDTLENDEFALEDKNAGILGISRPEEAEEEQPVRHAPAEILGSAVRGSSSNPIAIPGSVSSPPSSLSSMIPASLTSSSPLSAYSLGASVLTAVGGVAGYLQKSVKDAKDVVEFGVDSLYTTKDAVSEEAQALLEEVSTYMEHANAHEEGPTTYTESALSSSPPLTLTSSSLKMIASKASSPLIDGSGISEAFPGSSLSSPPNGQPSSVRSHSQEHAQGQTKHVNSTSSSSKTKAEFQVNAQLVRHLHVVEGKLILSHSHISFAAERVIDEHETVVVERTPGTPVDNAWRFLFKRRRWRIDDIASIYRRRYLLKPTALEIFIHSTRKNYFFNLVADDIVLFHEALMARRPLLLKRDPTVRRLRHPSSLFRNSAMSVRWVQHDISTFEYLMWLNTIAGRTYNDLTQYPVFPWILSDYESATLDLTRRGAYRDLTKPMGALEPTRLKFFIDRYNAFEDPDIPKFMCVHPYGTHYSNIGSVLYYLLRLEPFTSYALSLQGGKFDHADRLFHSVAETWNNCLMDYTDLKELTPEWFYLPEFLVNCNRLELGTRQNGTEVHDVILPPWARSPEDFVLNNLSEYVSANIHHWIDLVFGSKQRGASAIEANNVFFYLTYEGMVDVDSIADPVIKSSMQSQIAHFGQTPTQVLRDPHPQRHVLANTMGSGSEGASMKAAPLLATAEVNPMVLNVPHEAPVVLVELIPGTSLLVCLDSNGMLSSHRFGLKLSRIQHHQSPFLNDLSTSATKASSAFKSKGGVSNLSAGVEHSGEFIELQDRKSRKVLGEKRLLSTQQSVSNSMAFLNGGMVLCTVGHHDFSARFHSTTDGTLLYRLLQHQSLVTCLSTSSLGTILALGSTDGTLSVWKVVNITSTLLDSLKLFRGSKASSKPVQASDYSADQVLLGHNARINCVSVSDELGVCISGSASNECLAHSLEDGSILHRFDIPGHLEPGVISLAVSNVGHVVLQSLGSGTPWLYSFHLNGTRLAELSLGERPMTSLSICARYSKVVVSNSARALVLTAHTLDDQRVLLEQDTYGEIAAQALAPDEVHVVFGIGSGKVVSLPILPSCTPPHRTEM
ncbi:hypothetical protein BBJ28_00015788 [Nothophytophthora sp. Chile5]|nr:hypothetical protein BBJ28_00015788 [Nothophytophthora sp. Chile5]